MCFVMFQMPLHRLMPKEDLTGEKAKFNLGKRSFTGQ